MEPVRTVFFFSLFFFKTLINNSVYDKPSLFFLFLFYRI